MRRLALLLLLCATLAGCTAISDQADLQTRIDNAGFSRISTFHRSVNGTDFLEIRASGPGKKADEIAEIVWDTYPEHIDQLQVVLDGTEQTYTNDELRTAFGERLITERPDDDGDTARTVITWVIVAVVAVLLFIVGLIILIVVLVRRSNRRKQQQPPHYPPPPPGWPPAGPPPAA